MRKTVVLIGTSIMIWLASNAHASINSVYSGSLSTPVLYDSTSYGKAFDERVPVADPPGGLVATAAWYQYGMRLDWSVTKNLDNSYTYDYKFGPGWYPAFNPKGDPYVTNKQFVTFGIQLGTGLTMADLINPHWTVYSFNGSVIGSGTASQYTKGSVTGHAAMLSVGNLSGETGYSIPVYAAGHEGDANYITNWIPNYTMNNLFYGLEWKNPMDASQNYLFNNDVTISVSFTSNKAPGWGNFFTDSWQAGVNNDYSDVVAYNSSDMVTDPSMFGLPVHFNNTVAVAGGAPVPLPPSIYLLAAGLLGMATFRRRGTVV